MSQYFLVITILLSVIVSQTMCEEFKYKIIAPEYICGKDNASHTIIRLVGDDLPKLGYNWSLTFKMTDNNNVLNQRHVLMVWRSVRDLEKSLNDISSEEINRGIIFINNSMLTSGIQYIFTVTAQDKENKTSIDSQQFSMEYVNENNLESAISATLFGPEIAYADILYTVTAEITTCSKETNYQISWQILDDSEEIVRDELTKSRILQIRPGTLTSGNIYGIKCEMLDSKNNLNKSSPILWVKVLLRDLELYLYPQKLRTGINQPVLLNTFFNNANNNDGELTFDWKCYNTLNEECEEFENNNSSELSLPEGFSEPGSYLFNLEVKKGDIIVNATSTVTIVEELLPVIELENVMTSCTPSDTLRILAHVSQLISGCFLQWTCLNLPDYTYIDLSNAPGDLGQLFNITNNDEEEYADEFGNHTIAKQFDLILPPSDGDSWVGLTGDSEYIFRLIASCPSNSNVSSEAMSNITNQSGSNVTNDNILYSFVDVEVHVSEIPILKTVQVYPETGEALRTLFTFKTEYPETLNHPVLFKFGYIDKLNKSNFIVSQYESVSAVSVLPFTAEAVQVVLEVCDSKNLCNGIFGPKVTVQLPANYTDAEIHTLINNFNKSIFEQDYLTGFILATMLLQTTNQLPSKDIFNTSNENIKNIIKNELNNFINAKDNSWQIPAGNFIRYIKILDEEFNLPEDILNDILTIRDKISEKQNNSNKKQMKWETFHNAPSRKLLFIQTSKKTKRIVYDISIDEVRDYLEITELAIKRLTNFERVEAEKLQLREKLNSYMPRICQYLYNHYKTDERIELSTLLFTIEKFNLARKYNEIVFVPYEILGEEKSAKIKIGREIAEKYKNQHNLCIGKILFMEDFFNISQFVYDIKLFPLHSKNYLGIGKLDSFSVTIEIPVKLAPSSNQMFQCVLWSNDEWDFDMCKTLEESEQIVKCACKSLGYFSIVPIERTTTTNKFTTKTSIAVSQSTESIIARTEPVTNEKYQVTFTQSSTVTNDKEMETSPANKSNVNITLILLLIMLIIGITSMFFVFVILLRRYKQYTGTQHFPCNQYAKYFDEHNLE